MALGAPLFSQQNESKERETACREYVQRFYDWYVPHTRFKAAKKRQGPALDVALKYRRLAFDPKLVKQIEDAEVQAKREGEAFLDFDPILNSQDPSDHYEARRVIQVGNSYRSEIYGTSSGESERPDVIAELELKSGRWLFVDFHYPNSTHPDNASLSRMLERILNPRPNRLK